MPKSLDKADITNGDLLDVACELDGASEAFHDLSVLLHAIHNGNLKPVQITSIARTMQLTCETWSNLLDHNKSNLEIIVGRTVSGD